MMEDKSCLNQEFIRNASFKKGDMKLINERRRDYNRLGFAYQLAFARIFNYFPEQKPFETQAEILSYVSVALRIPEELIEDYTARRQTIGQHQALIKEYLCLSRFGNAEKEKLESFLFEESKRLDQASFLIARAELFLKEQRILRPAIDTIRRIVVKQRGEARRSIFQKASESLLPDDLNRLNELLDAEESGISTLQKLKRPPGLPSPKAMLRLVEKIETIDATGVMKVDLSWLNNNFQRSLARYARRRSADRVRRLEENRRHTVLICFLRQLYLDTMDFMVDMLDKLMTKVYKHAENDVDERFRKRRKLVRESLTTLLEMGRTMLDDDIKDSEIRPVFFGKIDRETLKEQLDEVETSFSGKYSHVFNLVVQRFSYIRQFSPAMLKHLKVYPGTSRASSLLEAIDTLKNMNEEGRRKLPEDAPLDFLPKKLAHLVIVDGKASKAAWECALLTRLRDDIKSGNLAVKRSKRFGHLDDFFIPESKWETLRENFFKRAGLPSDPLKAAEYLKTRLESSFDEFLRLLPGNAYAKLDEHGWDVSADPAETMTLEETDKLDQLNSWLSERMRVVKLPELLIEVDNDLKFTKHFLNPPRPEPDEAEDICAVLTAVMAHGCNIGTHTISRLVDGVSYKRLKHISDWRLTEESQRSALAAVVNGISGLDISGYWGDGKTSSSDGQRFAFKRKVLQRTFSMPLHEFALEFYYFIADNFAPFYGIPKQCAERDAPYSLDGHLYNESDLVIEEHYTDTSGYTEINFAAFAMLGIRFSPRIKGMKKQRIYRLDADRNYGSLAPLLDGKDRSLRMDWITSQWDRIARFYASMEQGHVTASTALKRLNGFTVKNHFYRANRELGRIFKTEHILQYMSDPFLRKRIRRGLLKGEQMNALARDVSYGKRGRLDARDFHEQKNSCSCLTLIMACIIYWQAKEISRVISEHESTASGIDLSMIEHVSPIGWDNVILYGEYVLDRSLVRL